MPETFEQNVLRKMNLINAATYNISHEVTKSENLLMPGTFVQNVLRKMNLINVATENIGHEITKSKSQNLLMPVKLEQNEVQK